MLSRGHTGKTQISHTLIHTYIMEDITSHLPCAYDHTILKQTLRLILMLLGLWILFTLDNVL